MQPRGGVPAAGTAVGPGTESSAVLDGEPACAETLVCLADAVALCADEWAFVDVPYTRRLRADGGWEWVGGLVGLDTQATSQEAPLAPDPGWISTALACVPLKGQARRERPARRPIVEGE